MGIRAESYRANTKYLEQPAGAQLEVWCDWKSRAETGLRTKGISSEHWRPRRSFLDSHQETKVFLKYHPITTTQGGGFKAREMWPRSRQVLMWTFCKHVRSRVYEQYTAPYMENKVTAGLPEEAEKCLCLIVIIVWKWRKNLCRQVELATADKPGSHIQTFKN